MSHYLVAHLSRATIAEMVTHMDQERIRAPTAERNNEQSAASRAGQLVGSSAPWVNVSDADSHRVHVRLTCT